MKYAYQLSEKNRVYFNHNWKWFLTWGLILSVLGIVAISTAVLTTLFSMIFLGALFLIGGIVILTDNFHFWHRKWEGFTPYLLMGILYFVIGLIFILAPLPVAISLTLILAIFFILIGAFRIYYSIARRFPWWQMSLLNGVITFLLGILIIAQWPASGLYILGIFVGIDLLLLGMTYVMISFTAKASTQVISQQ